MSDAEVVIRYLLKVFTRISYKSQGFSQAEV